MSYAANNDGGRVLMAEHPELVLLAEILALAVADVAYGHKRGWLDAEGKRHPTAKMHTAREKRTAIASASPVEAEQAYAFLGSPSALMACDWINALTGRSVIHPHGLLRRARSQAEGRHESDRIVIAMRRERNITNSTRHRHNHRERTRTP
jgi:hypothetical protein